MEILICIWNVLLKLFQLDLQAQTLTIKVKMILSAQENSRIGSN